MHLIAPDGETLYVANADNNCVAVIDIESPRRSEGERLHSDRLVSDVRGHHSRRQAVAGRSGKGKPDRVEQAGPGDAEGSARKTAAKEGYRDFPFLTSALRYRRPLSIVAVSRRRQRPNKPAEVYKQLPLLRQAASPAPRHAQDGDSRESRRPFADQARALHHQGESHLRPGFGDIPRGNGDPCLLMFGEEVTPNHHKLAEEYVLLDNLYCNGHVSEDGHPW